MSSETVIGLTVASIITILGGIAGATYFITRRLSTLTERLNNTIKNIDKLENRITYIEQLKMQESQQIVPNWVAELKKDQV